MNRSILWMRRTLQCAVFVCPIALISPFLAGILQLIWAIAYILPSPVAAPLWKKRQETPAALLMRILFTCSLALCISRLPALVIVLMFPHIHSLSLMLLRFLTAASSVLLQCMLLGKAPRNQRELPLRICLYLGIFIVCTLSGA